jgi:hypothetical protein
MFSHNAVKQSTGVADIRPYPTGGAVVMRTGAGTPISLVSPSTHAKMQDRCIYRGRRNDRANVDAVWSHQIAFTLSNPDIKKMPEVLSQSATITARVQGTIADKCE